MKFILKKLFASLGLMCLVGMPCYGTYYSQIGQDEIANTRYFKNKKSGVFVDIGAHNGIHFSNTYFFEKELGWTGLCIEPIPEVFADLKKNRICTCVEGCISDRTGKGQFMRVKSSEIIPEMLSGLMDKYDSRHLERVKQEIKRTGGSYETLDVNCYLFNDLMDKYGIKHVDFLSIDTEGGEFDIIASIDYSKITIDVITLEDNYCEDAKYRSFLESKGFTFIERNQFDLLFVRTAFLKALAYPKSKI